MKFWASLHFIFSSAKINKQHNGVNT